MSAVVVEKLSNGLTVLVEELPYAQSISYQLRLPGGILYDSPETVGASLLLADLLARGAGKMDAQALAQEFDNNGILHGESAALDRFVIEGACLASAWPEALSLLHTMVREPHLAEEEINPVRQLLMFDIASVLDNPARRVMAELRSTYYPQPYGRPTHGESAGLDRVNAKVAKDEWEKFFVPGGAILSVAGNVDARKIIGEISTTFESWFGSPPARPPFGEVAINKIAHVQSDTAQLQIGVAYPSVDPTDDRYYAARVATGVLHTGMSGRLFVEVREKRGLCYSVHARMAMTRENGAIIVYAGTTPERAQETLDVIQSELNGLAGTVTAEELQRAKTNLKASLIIGEESPRVRAAENVEDLWNFNRVRPREEIESAIAAISVECVQEYLTSVPLTGATITTLGSKSLSVA